MWIIQAVRQLPAVFGIALATVGVALLGTALIPLGDSTTYVLFTLAVIVSAWYGGFWAGVLAIVLGVGSTALLLIDPDASFPADSAVRLLLFVGSSLLVSFWAASQRRTTQALSEAEERFRLLMRNVDDYAIVILDQTGRIVDWNSGAEKITGIGEADAGNSLDIIFPRPQSDRGTGLQQEMRTAIHHGSARDERWHVRRDGSRFWGFGILTPLRDSHRRLAGYVKIFRDLTPLKHREDERDRLIHELEKANEEKQRFLGVLAHDLRNPLNTILGWVAVAENDDHPQTSRKALQVVRRSAEQQLRLMEELLKQTQAASGLLDLSLETCDLNEILLRAIEEIRPAADLKEARIDYRFEGDRRVDGDPVRLSQVFNNLLSNAVKYLQPRGYIQIRRSQSKTSARVVISDTGPGIAPESIQDIFEPYRRANQTGAPGAGLGLAIVRDIVEQHHGRVWAESAGVGRGASFIVELPVASNGNRR